MYTMPKFISVAQPDGTTTFGPAPIIKLQVGKITRLTFHVGSKPAEVNIMGILDSDEPYLGRGFRINVNDVSMQIAYTYSDLDSFSIYTYLDKYYMFDLSIEGKGCEMPVMFELLDANYVRPTPPKPTPGPVLDFTQGPGGSGPWARGVAQDKHVPIAGHKCSICEQPPPKDSSSQ